MNTLSFDRQVAVISALTEGVSIRATERLTGVHRDTIMRLGVKIGEGCAMLHDRMMRGLQVPILEFDEIWSYIGKKQRMVQPGEADMGDCYTFIALDATRKAIISHVTGKRNEATTRAFVNDVWERIVNRPQITSDGYGPYIEAVAECFGDGADYAQLVKHYAADHSVQAARRHSPPQVVRVERMVVSGRPKPRHLSTSYVERSNLTLRMQQRRFTRLTNGFSKKLRNHEAAVALYVAHYNLCRVHEALRVTPAMTLGVTDHIWTIGELIEAATAPQLEGRPSGRFRVIDGGLEG
ncbi:MAG: DDE-type integrase/transposase/recombinase [Proteobacteria bacterium]|nr:DDE-type integrase/transposase/recombinase [Pseudomonadota bacterium]